MVPSARSSARPSVELKYWTADASGENDIEEWLATEIDGEPAGVFYASFLNWCSAQVDKLKNPRSKYKTAEEKVKAEEVRYVLRQQPLDVREFIGLMERCFRDSWPGGVKSGYIPRPNDSAKAGDIMEGDQKLRSIVWTQRERDVMMLEIGERPKSKKGNMKLERTRREIEAEEEERRTTAEQWKSMNEAVGEVEEEIEIDDTTAAMDGFAISQQVPWQGDLADRTRD